MKYWLILRMGIIIFLLCLDISLFLNGQTLSPSKCQLTFNSQTASRSWGGLDRNIFVVNITDLYASYLKDECLVKWSARDGYVKS